MTEPTDRDATHSDVGIIGAGPAGLYQVFALGLLELSATVYDALPGIGGQCTALYGDKPIYDIPGTPRTTAAGLIDALGEQMRPFQPNLRTGCLVDGLTRLPDGRFELRTDDGCVHRHLAVVLASGPGAFVPRRLNVPGIDAVAAAGRLEHHRHGRDDAQSVAGLRVVVVGDSEAAVLQACDLAEARRSDAADAPASVTLTHRRDQFRLDDAPELAARLARCRAEGALAMAFGTPERAEAQTLHLIDADGRPQALTFDRLFVRLGLSPRLGPLADWGVALERRQIVVDPATFATAVAGLHAVGDAITYPGKRRLIVSAFHEATLAAYAIADAIKPGGAGPLQYTTTSPRLHALLGVSSPSA